MKQKLDYYLVKRFPDFFKGRFEKEDVEYWGFECDDGWFQIIFQACSLVESHIQDIQKNNDFRLQVKEKIIKGEDVNEYWTKQYNEDGLIPNDVPQFRATQIKEKFGTLRFYYNGGDEFIGGVISAAENISAHTCEICGNPGKLRSGGWMRTLCDKHAKEGNKIEKKNNILQRGDIIEALVKGATKNIIIKKISENHWIGQEINQKYDHKKEQYVSIEGEEIYNIKKEDTEMFTYYDATLIK